MRRRIFGVWRLLPTTFRVEGLKFRRRVACAVCVALLDIESRCGGKILCNQTPHLDNHISTQEPQVGDRLFIGVPS
jgi:hypothetical protein